MTTTDLPVVVSGDSRETAKMRILRRPDGRRYIEVDGVEFPTFTDGEITVTEHRTGAYMPSGGYWPATPDEEWDPNAGSLIRYYVNLTLILDSVEIETPELLDRRPVEDDDD